jgi:hypothetical protein
VPYVNPLTEQADTDPEDLALVARVQTGSRQALETLLTRHQPWIYNILVRVSITPQEAEDATQPAIIYCDCFCLVSVFLVPIVHVAASGRLELNFCLLDGLRLPLCLQVDA